MITTQEMKELEKNCGISQLNLMENAGRGIFNYINENIKDLSDKKILIISYHGNNGGDGFAAANFLSKVAEVDVLFIGDEDKLKPESRTFFKKVEENVMIQLFQNMSMIDFSYYDIIIDAILGLGIKGKLKETIATIIRQINKSESMIISVDVPSGIDPDTSEIKDIAIEPTIILSMHDMKKGLEKYKDKVNIIDIGIKA